MVDLDSIYRIALENAAAVKTYRKRFLYEEIKKKLAVKGKIPALLISGLRGVGKTTLLLQIFDGQNEAHYFSADSILVRTSTLYAVVEQLYRSGYKTIFIDEIHSYPRWVEELKNIYDNFDVQIIASGSSVASIRKGSLLLGRRALDMVLPPLTFGEFLYLREGYQYQAKLPDVFNQKSTFHWLAEHPSVEKYYREYLATGGFPLRIEETGVIFKLTRRMIYEDALAEFNLTKNKVDLADKILAFLSISTLGEFSYTSFSSFSGYAKSSVYEAVHMLKELGIIDIIEEETPKSKAKGTIKLLFSHPNLRLAFASQLLQEAGVGALREEYFIFHLRYLGLPVFVPKHGKKNPDYEVYINNKRMLFEIGGKSKGSQQLEGKEGIILNDLQLQVLGFVQKTDQK